VTSPTAAEPVRLLDEDQMLRHAELMALFERRASRRLRRLAVHFALLRRVR